MIVQTMPSMQSLHHTQRGGAQAQKQALAANKLNKLAKAVPQRDAAADLQAFLVKLEARNKATEVHQAELMATVSQSQQVIQSSVTAISSGQEVVTAEC